MSLALISNAKLHFLYATPANVRFSSRSGERFEYLKNLKTRAEPAGVRTRVDEQHGDPAAVIVLHANARKIDLVVLGSNRRSGLRRLREGSVSERVSVVQCLACADRAVGGSCQGPAQQEPRGTQAATGASTVTLHQSVRVALHDDGAFAGQGILAERSIWPIWRVTPFSGPDVLDGVSLRTPSDRSCNVCAFGARIRQASGIVGY